MLEGSIQQLGDRSRVTARLVRVADGATIWSLERDNEGAGVFKLQDTISEQIAGKLSLELSGDEQKRLAKRYTDNAQAYQEYVKGRFDILQPTTERFSSAVAHFSRAIELDSTYALAYAGLADAYCSASGDLLPSRDALPKARSFAEKAVALDDTLAEGYAALGHAKLHSWDITAERDLQKALALNPNSVMTLLWYGEYYRSFDPTRAVAMAERAKELDPTSPAIRVFLIYTCRLARQADCGEREAREALRLHPQETLLHMKLAQIYDLQRKYAEALEELDESPREPYTESLRACLLAKLGRRVDAEGLLKTLLKRSEVDPNAAYNLGVLYAALGDKDQAFAWLEKACNDRSSTLGLIKFEPELDPLRSDPRFSQLVRRIGL